MKTQRKRTCAKMICICLMLSLVPSPVSAAETGEAVGSHEHTSECYTWAEACTHEHTPECYSRESISENEATPSEAVEPVECSHICSAESGCITKELNCQYDEEKGSIPAAEEMPQENEPGEEMEQEAEIATPSNAQKSTAEGRNVEEFDELVPEVQNNAVLLAATQYTYTLHYDANGGSGAPADQVVTSTALYVQIPVSSTIPVRDGYTFKGWANTRTGRVVYNYGNSATIAQGADNTKTIYAIWEAHVHSWGEWTSNGNGTHTRTCSTDSSHTETNDCSGGEPTCTEKAICENCHAAYGNPLGHYFEWMADSKQHWKQCVQCHASETKMDHSGGTATCTQKAVCEICITAYGNPLGHDFTSQTWQSDADNHWKKCSRCDAIDSENGHDWDSGEVTIKPTCTTAGQKTFTCAVCSAIHLETIGAFGHTFVRHNAKAATCTEKGWKAYDTCSRCDYTTYAELPALGHDPIHHNAKAATCMEKGWNAYDTCSRCDYTTYAELSALGHDFSLLQHNEKQHWKKCSRCEAIDDKENHSGGTATCKDKAVCSICSAAYGELNADNHAGGTEVRDRAEATTNVAGYTGDIYCKGCNKKIQDGTRIPKLASSSGSSGSGGGSSSAGSVSSKEQHRPSVVDDQARWVQNGTDWKLILSSGETAADRWVQKGGHWYWFKADGIMAHSGWLLYMGHWYYLNAGGDMITGWLFWNEHWYYLKADGIMAADEMTPDGYRIGPDGSGFRKNEITNQKRAFTWYITG